MEETSQISLTHKIYKMKKASINFFTLLLLMAGFTLFSCNHNDNDEDGIKITGKVILPADDNAAVKEFLDSQIADVNSGLPYFL